MEIKRTTILGLNARYLETIPDDTKATIVVLHGWGSKIESWEGVARLLEIAGFRVLVPDLPGFGETEEPKTPWKVDDYINFLNNFLESLDVKDFILVGHSFGGQIAISYASSETNRAKALVLMGAARIEHRKKLKVKIFGIISAVGDLPFKIPPLHMAKPVVQKIWYKITGERDYYRASELMKETMKHVLAETVGHRLESIKIPTLVLWGEADKATPLEDGESIKEKIAGSKLITFPGAGHAINLERTNEVARKIGEFVETL